MLRTQPLLALALILVAFAIDAPALPARGFSTLLIVLAFWGADLLALVAWEDEENAATEDVDLAPCQAPEPLPNFPTPWYRRRYNPGPRMLALLTGAGGITVGLIVAASLGDFTLRSGLLYATAFAILALLTRLNAELDRPGNPHRARYVSSISQAYRLTLTSFFAIGFWQPLPWSQRLLSLILLYPTTLYAIGVGWSLILLVQALRGRTTSGNPG